MLRELTSITISVEPAPLTLAQANQGRFASPQMASACELRRMSHDEPWAGSEPYNILDWDGPEEDANPLYWGTPKKVLNVACVSIFNFLT